MKRIIILAVALVAVLVPTAAEAGLPLETVQCGEPIARSMKIANNIFGCSGDGLVIVANGITLDLGGNRVSAGLSNDDIGVRCDGCRDVRIRNGSVEGFGTGVALGADSRRVSVRNVRALANDVGFEVDGRRHTLQGNFAVENTPGDGFSTLGARNALIENTADGNGGDGFHVRGIASRLTANIASDNAGDGFDTAIERNVLVRNLARDNTFGGFVTNGTEHELRNNRADGNSTGFTNGGSEHILSGNRARASGFDGFTTIGSNHRYTGNVATGSERLGFSFGGSGNVARFNRAGGNDQDGFFVFATGNVLRENSANGNGVNGINVIGGSGHVVVENVARTNGFINGVPDGDGLGIRVDGAVTNLTAKKNKASNNDDTAQCSAAANCQ